VPEPISQTTNGTVHKERTTKLHRPYDLSDTEEEEEDKTGNKNKNSSHVVTTLSQRETMNLIYSNTFHKSPADFFPREKSVLAENGYSRTREEEFRKLAPVFHHSTLTASNGSRSPPPLEKIIKQQKSSDDSVFAGSPNARTFPRVFDYNWVNPIGSKPFENQAVAYETSLLKASYDKLRYSTPFCGSPPISSPIANDRNPPMRSPSKARMKYTPVRENIYGEDLSVKDATKMFLNFSTAAAVSSSTKSPTLFSSRSSVDERKPYHRGSMHLETDLVRSMNLHSVSASQYDLDHPLKRLSNDISDVKRRFSESLPAENNRNPNSAFSVIRPHFHRMYSTESGYSSDPSNNKLFKPYETFEKSEILARRHITSVSDKLLTEIKTEYRKDYRLHSSNGADIDKEIGVSKLHVSDEASKETLKAFDAHVEKIMAETRMRGAVNGNVASSPKLSLTGKHEKDIVLSSTTNGHLVQCSTVDSSTSNNLKNTELTHGVGGLLGLTRIANEHLGQAIAKEKKRSKSKCHFLLKKLTIFSVRIMQLNSYVGE